MLAIDQCREKNSENKTDKNEISQCKKRMDYIEGKRTH
jgi:hypothetical protein